MKKTLIAIIAGGLLSVGMLAAPANAYPYHRWHHDAHVWNSRYYGYVPAAAAYSVPAYAPAAYVAPVYAAPVYPVHAVMRVL